MRDLFPSLTHCPTGNSKHNKEHTCFIHFIINTIIATKTIYSFLGPLYLLSRSNQCSRILSSTDLGIVMRIPFPRGPYIWLMSMLYIDFRVVLCERLLQLLSLRPNSFLVTLSCVGSISTKLAHFNVIL